MPEDVKEKVYAFLNDKKELNQVSMMTSVDELIQAFSLSSINVKTLFMDWVEDTKYARNITATREGRVGFAKLIGLPARNIDKRTLKEEKQNAQPEI